MKKAAACMAKRAIPIIIVLVILMAILTSSYSVLAPGLAKVKIRKKATLKNGYVVIDATIEVVNGSLSVLSFKIPLEYREKLIYIRATAGQENLPIKVTWNEIIIILPKMYQSIRVTEIYELGMEFEETTVKLLFPLTVTPREALGDAYIEVKTPVKSFLIDSPAYLNKTDSVAVANLSLVAPGKTDIAALSFYQADLLWFSVIQLNRTIIIENSNEVVFVDEYLIENNVGGKLEHINLQLPPNATIKRLEGLVGVYTGRGGDGAFYTWVEENKTMTSISLRSVLWKRGEREYLKVVYSLPVKFEEDTLKIPAYHSSGLPIDNYNIVVKIAGDGQLLGLTPRFVKFADGYRIIGLQNKGLLLDEIPVEDPYITLKVYLDPTLKIRPYLVLGAFSFILALIAIAFVQRSRAVEVEVKRTVKIEAPEEVLKEAKDLYEEKIKLLEDLAEAKIRRLTAKISRQLYRQKVAKINSKRKTLESKISKLRERIGKAPLLDEIERMLHEVERKIDKFEDAYSKYRRGEISKKAFKEEIEKIREEIEAITSKIYSRLSALEIE